MKDAPAFDFYAQRWLAGTMDMTAEERGAYINLLCRQWEDDGLTDDPKRLAAVARCRPATLALVLLRFPVGEDGKRRNSRLEITRQEQRARIAKSREKIEKMNAARAGKSASCRDSTSTSIRVSCRDSTRPSSPLTTHPVEDSSNPAGQSPPLGFEVETSTKKKPAAKSEADPPDADHRHHEITSRFGATYRMATGEPYPFDVKDAARLKRFLSGWHGTADEFLTKAFSIITTGRTSQWAGECKRSQSIANICNNWTSAVAELNSITSNGNHSNRTPRQPAIVTRNTAPLPAGRPPLNDTAL